MKTLKLFSLCALALITAFSSCKENDPIDLDDIIEDGFYIMGDASGADKLSKAGMMQSGINENGQAPKAGLYEKYIALEAGATFSIVKKVGTVETIIGSDVISEITTDGTDYSINGAKVQFGTYKEDGTAFSVPVSQLYQVVVYEETNAVAIIPVKWQTNGLGTPDSLGLVGTFNKTTMTYKLENVTVDLGNFKIKSYNGWKFNMTPNETEPTDKVFVNCNFGATKTGDVADEFKFDGTNNNVLPGGPDIAIAFANRGKYTVELIWTLSEGWSHVLKFTKTGDLAVVDPSTFVYSLIGSAFNNASGTQAAWDYDLDLVYSAASSTITDQNTKAGTHVFKVSNVTLIADGEFKVRKDHDWATSYGYNADNIKGDVANFVDNGGNIKVVAGKTYSSIEFKLTWPANTWEIHFNN
jgi:hypothetical protein